MKTLFLSMATISLFLLFSCQKEEPLNYQPSSDRQIELRDFNALSEKDKKRVDFAKVFATALSNNDLRSYMKQQYTTLDGNNDEFIYGLHYDDVISGDQTLAQLLSTYADTDILNKHGNSFLTDIISEDVLLTVDFPDVENYSISTWEESSDIPEIAISTKNEISFEDGSSGYPGWNSSGALINYDFQVEPNEVTLLVKSSEIYVVLTEDLNFEDGTTIAELFGGEPCDELAAEMIEIAKEIALDPNNIRLVVKLQDLINLFRDLCIEEDENNNGGSDPCEEMCERDCVEADEHIWKFRITSKDVWDAYDCGWSENRSDFIIFIYGVLHGGLKSEAIAIIPLKPMKRKQLLDCNLFGGNCVPKWIQLENHESRYMPDWDKNKYERIIVQFAETGNGNGPSSFRWGLSPKVKIVDPTTKTEIELKLLDLGFNFNLTDGDCAQDISLGTKSIWYCDQANKSGMLYGTGSVDFVAGHNAPN